MILIYFYPMCLVFITFSVPYNSLLIYDSFLMSKYLTYASVVTKYFELIAIFKKK